MYVGPSDDCAVEPYREDGKVSAGKTQQDGGGGRRALVGQPKLIVTEVTAT